MSSIAPVSSVASQPPVTPVQAVRVPPDQQAAEQARKAAQLAATAVAAQVGKQMSREAGKGLIVDFQV